MESYIAGGFGPNGPKFWDYMYGLQQTGQLCDVQFGVKSDETGDILMCPAHKTVLAASCG